MTPSDCHEEMWVESLKPAPSPQELRDSRGTGPRRRRRAGQRCRWRPASEEVTLCRARRTRGGGIWPERWSVGTAPTHRVPHNGPGCLWWIIPEDSGQPSSLPWGTQELTPCSRCGFTVVTSSPGSPLGPHKPTSAARSLRGPACRLCLHSNAVFTEKTSVLLFSHGLWTGVNHSSSAAGPQHPPKFILVFLTHMSFLSEILRVPCSQTGCVRHSVHQNSLVMTRPPPARLVACAPKTRGCLGVPRAWYTGGSRAAPGCFESPRDGPVGGGAERRPWAARVGPQRAPEVPPRSFLLSLLLTPHTDAPQPGGGVLRQKPSIRCSTLSVPSPVHPAQVCCAPVTRQVGDTAGDEAKRLPSWSLRSGGSRQQTHAEHGGRDECRTAAEPDGAREWSGWLLVGMGRAGASALAR